MLAQRLTCCAPWQARSGPAVERDLASAPADAPCHLVAPEDRAGMVRGLAFARLQAKVRRDGRPEDEAMNLWLDADRPADVPRPAAGAYGSGATIGTTEVIPRTTRTIKETK